MSEQSSFQGYIVDIQSRCLRRADSEESIPFDSPRGLQIRAVMALSYKNIAELEDQLKRGDVIELTLPDDANAFLLLDEQGKFCFLWEDCYHGQGEEQPYLPFETVEQALLWIFSCLYSASMTRQEAVQRYSGEFSTYQVKHVLKP